MIYLNMRLPANFKEPTLGHTVKDFINLVLVCKDLDRHLTERERKESILLKLHGNVDCIARKKTQLKITDLAKCDEGQGGTSQKRDVKLADNILVEGAPGVGKTTFAWRICQEWARGTLLKEWSIVLLIQLRDQDVREAKNLYELIYHPDQTVREEICQILLRGYGKGTMFVLDGYDELAHFQRAKDSVIQHVFSRKLLPRATLLILSRPIATRTLPMQFYSHVDQHIEILGFTEKNIDCFIDSACKDDLELAATFKAYLSSHPFIYSLMYIPLQCAIVTDLYCTHWKRGDKEFSPKTLTEFYADIVRTLLLRFLSDQCEYSHQIELREFTDLPGEVYEQFKALAQLAARGIQERVYVFDSGVPEESLGLMYQVEEVYPGRGRSVSYSFLHLTLQEYLAAYHWSKQPEIGRTVEQLFPLDAFIEKYSNPGDLHSDAHVDTHWPVLLFIAGMTKLSWCGHGDLQVYRRRISFRSFETVKSSFLHLLYETQCPDLIQLALAVATAGDEEAAGHVFLRTTPKTALDFFVSGYCISHSNRLWEVVVAEYVEPEHFAVLSKGLCFPANTGGACGRIDKLILCKLALLPVLSQLHPHVKCLRELHLESPVPVQHLDGSEVFEQFPLYCPVLETLYAVIDSSPIWQALFRTLPFLSSLLTLNVCSIEETDMQPLMASLWSCSCIRIQIGTTTPSGSALQLRISPRLEYLELHGFSIAQCVGIEYCALRSLILDSCKLLDDAYTSLVHFIQSPKCTLNTLAVLCGKPTIRTQTSALGFMEDLVQAVRTNWSLTKLHFIDIPFSPALLELLCGSIRSNNTLEELTVMLQDVDNSLQDIGDHSCHNNRCSQVKALLTTVSDHSAITKLRLNKLFTDRGNVQLRDDLQLSCKSDYISWFWYKNY